jgi:Cell division septal protein
MNTVNQVLTDDIAEETVKVVNLTGLYPLAFSVLFIAFMAWGVYHILSPSTLPIRQVSIEGEFRYLSPDELHDLVRHSVRGSFFNIDVAGVRNALLANPWVRDVAVHRVWPDQLLVFVTEQIALARWKDTGLLNKSGEYFSPARSTFPEDLPILDGPEGSQAMLLEKFIYLEKLLHAHAMHVSALRLDERRAWFLELNRNLTVVLGREDFNERVSRLANLTLINLAPKISYVSSIDMRYPNGYAVRWQQSNSEIQRDTGTFQDD